MTTRNFRVRHPDYGTRLGTFTKVPSTVHLELQPPAIIEGRVVFAEFGKPAAGILVRALSQSGREFDSGSELVHTDGDGRYRFVLPESNYNLWAHHEELTAEAIEGFVAESGRTNSAPDLRLIKGGLVAGQLVDAISGEPVILRGDDIAFLTIRGPARPVSSSAVQVEPINPDGSFRFRLPPGKSRLALPDSSYGSFALPDDANDRAQLGREVLIVDGQITNVEMRVVRVARPDDAE